MTPHESAIWWAERGLPVFPLIPKTKAPAISTGFHAASTDAKKIDLWWKKNPQYGVGVAIPDGIIVTDFDALAHEHLADTVDMELPETFNTLTPGKGGGKHFWWRLPDKLAISPKVEVMPGLDIRTKGSYVVVPPSEHPEGGCYQWGDVEELDIEKLPLCPAWVLEACMHDNKIATDSRERIDLLGMLKGIEPGARQAGLFRAACSMRVRGFAQDEAEVILRGICQASDSSDYLKKIPALIKRVWKRYEGVNRDPGAKIYTADQLLSMDLGDVNWFVEDMLAPGLALVWADEKVGKSAAFANLAYQLATREKVWGRYAVPKARGVLYLDLEQSALFGQRRWRKIFDGRTPPQNLRLAFEWPRMGEGGLEKIKDLLDLNSDIDVVVIDIFSLFKPTIPPPGMNAYDMDNHMLAAIRKMANQYGALFILIHHTNTSGQASGSRAMRGAQDYMFEIKREPSSSVASIDINGKNIPARKLIMEVDLEKMHWKAVGVQ